MKNLILTFALLILTSFQSFSATNIAPDELNPVFAKKVSLAEVLHVNNQCSEALETDQDATPVEQSNCVMASLVLNPDLHQPERLACLQCLARAKSQADRDFCYLTACRNQK